MRRVTLYGKPGCHLCERARTAVAAARSQRDFELEEVDIALDPRLSRLYAERIPVVAIDGREVLDLWIEPEELIRRLDRVDA